MTRALCTMAVLCLAAAAFAAEDTPAPLVCVRNRPLVPVSLDENGPYYMLLDLALPRPVISAEVAGYLKLETVPGDSPGWNLVTLRAFQWGGLPAVSKTCVSTDLVLLSGLLGMSVAGIVNPRELGAEMVLDIGRGGFSVHAASATVVHDEKDPRVVKMSRVGDLPAVPALLNGTVLRTCVLDTTFGGVIAVSEGLLLELGIALEKEPKLVVQSPPGYTGDPEGRVQIRLKDLRVGVAGIHSPVCTVEPGTKPPRIGVGFLKHFGATINFDRKLIRWEESAEPARGEPIVSCGLTLDAFRGGRWRVWVAAGSPADREGVVSGSELVRVNGKDMSDVSYAEACEALPSDEGKQAEITLMHDTETRTVTLSAEKLL